MGLQMIIGASGTGKSEYIYKQIFEMSKKDQKGRFFIVVPDQFTMQTQADMVRMAGGGIMNIDVLSFSRMAHRIFEETNSANRPVLDDTGKSLVLRRLASGIKDDIPYLSGNLSRTGFIHEVKSSISEFMQYGIGPEQLNSLIAYCEKKGALKAKLTDLKTLYERFIEYTGEQYITTEESMDLLARELFNSSMIKDSVVVFDGFTGFTPVQMKVVSALMQLCRMVYVTLTLEDPESKESLFDLTKRSYDTLIRTAKENGTEILKDFKCQVNHRFAQKPDLMHLERHIFRYPPAEYPEIPESLSIYEGEDVSDEVSHMAMQIRRLVSDGAYYRDIAVITGSIDSYESQIKRIFARYNIPTYIDKTRAIVLNPFVEYIKSLLKMIMKDFDHESVIRYLRSGMIDLDARDVDMFENFCIKSGFRGRKRYMSYIEDNNAELAEIANRVRITLTEGIKAVFDSNIKANGKRKATEYVKALYECCEACGVYDRIKSYEEEFASQGEFTMQKEYSQIYRLTMELFEQIYDLLGDEELTLEEFYDIVEAGFSEISVGTIPASVDRVIVGDMERSRLKPVKYLFFIGLDDGYVPKKSSKCSILSDMEREYLSLNDMQLELAPTPRQKLFIHRFYMYSNLVKPSEKLFLSYSDVDNEGKSLRPAYIIPLIKSLFGRIAVERSTLKRTIESIDDITGLKEHICDLMRRYAETGLGEDKKSELMRSIDILRAMGLEGSDALLDMFVKNSFFEYDPERLDAKIAGILYGEKMLASVSRMEQFASCAYAYFLRYGLSLKEREEYSLDNRDMGNIFHKTLETYGNKLAEKGLSWTDIPQSEAESILDEALDSAADKMGPILRENKEGSYIRTRMRKTLKKAVDVLTYQLKAGQYDISGLEVRFKRAYTLDEINVALSEKEKMELKGSIDRMDTLNKDDSVYVKVIDYKTGNRDFSLLNFYHGLQLQLVVYMAEGMKKTGEKFKGKEIRPGAMLYYRVADNTVNADNETDEEKINALIRQDLKTKGLINDDPENVLGLTGLTSGTSDIVNLGFNKDGSYSKRSSVINAEDMRLLTDYADYKLKKIGQEIISGNISKNPVKEDEQKDSCMYCSYKDICGFDVRLEGFDMKRIKKLTDDEILAKMREELK